MKNEKNINPANNFFGFMLRLFQMKSISIYQLTLSLLIITAVFSVGFIFASWTYTEIYRVKAKIKELKNASINKQKDKLKNEVSRLIFYLEYTQQDTAYNTQEQIKDKALLYFENMRFGNDGYVFVNTYDGIALLFDGQKLDEIKDISEIADPNGFKIFEKELELAKLPEGGSFQYLFKKIYTATPQPKLSYVMGFDQWGWIVGTGDYLDKVEKEVNLLEYDLERGMYRNILIACSIFILVLFVLIFAAYWFARWIQYQFNKFVLVLKQTSLNKNIEQPLDRVLIHELKTIGFEILQSEGIVKQFGDIIDQSLNEIYIFEQSSLKFVHANSGALKNCGYSLEEMQFMTPLDIKPELNLKQFQDLVAPLIEKKRNQIRFETVHQRKNKTLYPVDIHLTHSFFKDKPVFIAFIYDISERKKTEKQLFLSEQRYSEIFENAPISLWEEDFTELIVYLDAQLKQYNLPIETLFEKHPEILIQSASLVKVTDVNSRTLSLFEAQNKEDLFGNLNKLFSENSAQAFKQSILALYRGDEQYSTEGENLTLKGRKLEVLLRWSFLSKDISPARKIILSIVDLTDLHKTKKELFTANKIINRSPAVAFLWKNEEGWPVEFVAESVEKLTGYTMSEFITGKISYREIIHKDDIKRVGKEVADNSQKAGKDSFAHEDYRIITKKGEVKWVNDITFILKDSNGIITHYEGVVYDITEKHQIDDALQKSEERFKRLFKDLGDAVYVTRIGEQMGDILEVNSAAVKQSGYSREELLKMNIIHDLSVRESSEEISSEHSDGQLLTGKTVSYNEKKRKKNGEEYWTEIIITPIEFEGETAGLSINRDITERKIQDEKLLAALEAAKESDRIKTAFLANMSHELRTPLNAVIGFSDLIDDKTDPSDSADFARLINSSGINLLAIVNDIFEVTLIEGGQININRSEKTVSSFLNDIYQTILHRQKNQGLSTVIIEKELKSIDQYTDAFTDFAKLKQIFLSLLSNALKFTSEGFIRFGVYPSKDENELIFFVKDSGIGIPKEKHKIIFERFKIGDDTLTRKYSGVGVGLYISKKLITILGGKIWLESELGKGSTFYFSIPR